MIPSRSVLPIPVRAAAAMVVFTIAAAAQPPVPNEPERLLMFQGSTVTGFPGRLGAGLASLGDIDNDRCADFVMSGTNTVIAISGRTGTEIWRATSLYSYAHTNPFGLTGDVDGDGVPDVGICVFEFNQLQIVSGLTGATLQTTQLPQSNFLSPSGVVSLGSINGDTRSEYAVSSDGDGVRVFDGATHAQIAFFTLAPTLAWEVEVAAVPDVDGDGFRDLAIAYLTSFHTSSTVRVHSVAAMTQLASLVSTQAFTSVVGDDFDNDGIGDIVCGASIAGGSPTQNLTGSVTAFSIDLGAGTLMPRFTRIGINSNDRYGFCLDDAGDFDLDGVRDVLVGATGRVATIFGPGTPGRIEVLSGITGAVLLARATTFPGTLYGNAVANVGDVNDDGLDDIGVGEVYFNPVVGPGTIYGDGLVRIYTPVLPTCSAAPATISASAGGAQSINVFPGVAFAGQTYVILGSTSGNQPGTQLGPRLLPLVHDWYMDLTVMSANTGIFVNTLGALNSFGAGRGQVVLPAGVFTAFVGLSLEHAAAITPTDLTATTWTTNTVRLTITP